MLQLAHLINNTNQLAEKLDAAQKEQVLKSCYALGECTFADIERKTKALKSKYQKEGIETSSLIRQTRLNQPHIPQNYGDFWNKFMKTNTASKNPSDPFKEALIEQLTTLQSGRGGKLLQSFGLLKAIVENKAGSPSIDQLMHELKIPWAAPNKEQLTRIERQ